MFLSTENSIAINRAYGYPPKQTAATDTDRRFDVTLAITLLPIIIVPAVIRSLVGWYQTGQWFERRSWVGRNGRSFDGLYFSGHWPGAALALLINILRGDLSFVGPQPLSDKQTAGLSSAERHRYLANRPGLACRQRLQTLSGIVEPDRPVAADPSDRLGTLIRTAIALSLRGRVRPIPARLSFWGIGIDNIDLATALDRLFTAIDTRRPANVAFVNPHCLNIAYRQPVYRRVLQQAALVLPDGIGVKLGCRLQGLELAANLNGTDLFMPLCQRAAREGRRLYLLGGHPGVAERVAETLRRTLPTLRIVGCQHGYFDPSETSAVIDRINASEADIVLVAMGVPTQELWLAEYGPTLQAPLRLGVGGLFDFYSGRIPRAPLWLREIGLEWSWRLWQEPSRMWRRYLIGNPLFLYRVWRHRHGQTGRLDTLTRRSLDIALSAAALLTLLPLMPLVGALVRLDSPGPLFFSQTRIGQDGKPFRLWKIRSMHIDAEARLARLRACNEMTGGVLFKMHNDPRITRIGRLIRKASIDELPQLWNVLIGDMSLVGPRPALPHEVAQYSDRDRQRLAVKPGITCLWQVSGRSLLPFAQQVSLDLHYIEHQSLWLNLVILGRTVPAVLTARGAC